MKEALIISLRHASEVAVQFTLSSITPSKLRKNFSELQPWAQWIENSPHPVKIASVPICYANNLMRTSWDFNSNTKINMQIVCEIENFIVKTQNFSLKINTQNELEWKFLQLFSKVSRDAAPSPNGSVTCSFEEKKNYQLPSRII